ncbi:F0F1 ATP synthase subunit A [Mucilaginibacter flavidus]|uniref:F0F1 ATP synthase subunit A n=1 Tax=Mucilaginibacter flavidus TaxID=2949309 RepID=UPI00209232EB|nr:F0F1 ATP synthase subunit A [Mucilaginibacter flavidus]MCO5946385.1 F0F1 ATP synthase subunit A [Mucilaginibacter flavidus]
MKTKIFNITLICAFFLALGAFPTKALSQENKPEGGEKKFNPQEIIMEHIADKHEWHMYGKSYLPLPIILYTDKGLETFSSAHLQPQGTVYAGKYYSYMLVNNKIKVADVNGKIDEANNKKVLDFSITQNVASMWMTGIILILVFFSMSSAYRKRPGKGPKGIQSWMEPLVLFIRDDVALPNIGVKYKAYMPLLLTIFFFILINNIFGMIPVFPGAFNLTGNIAVTLVLSVIVLLVVNLKANKYYWKHIFVPNPWWLFPIMIPVEIVSIFSKPIALMIRLFANITAGHIIVLSLISLIYIFGTQWAAVVSVPFTVFIDCIEVLVAFLQAYIFTMLTSLFIGMAIQEHHDHEVI